MHKKALALITCSALLLGATAQTDLDRFCFNVAYWNLPQQPLDAAYNTYMVKIEASPLMKQCLAGKNTSQLVVIGGWQQVNTGGQVQVTVRLQDMMIEDVDVKEIVEIQKDKQGKETGRTIKYDLQVLYTFEATVQVKDYKGNLLLDYVPASRDIKRMFSGGIFKSKEEAEAFFKPNADQIGYTIAKQMTETALWNTCNTLTYNYGFTEQKGSDCLWMLDSKKNAEYTRHREACLAVKQAFFSMTATGSLEGVRAALQPAINYFEQVKSKYRSSSKNDRKLRYASFYNLSKIYYYLDDAEKAMREASGLVLNDFDARDGRTLEAAATGLQTTLQQAGMKTRHFPIVVQGAAAVTNVR